MLTDTHSVLFSFFNQEKVSDLYDNASKTIWENATSKDPGPSEKIEEASAAVINGAGEVMKTANNFRQSEKVG